MIRFSFLKKPDWTLFDSQKVETKNQVCKGYKQDFLTRYLFIFRNGEGYTQLFVPLEGFMGFS